MVPAQQPIGPSRQTLNPPAAMSLAPTVAAAATVPEAPVVQIVVPVYWQPSIQSYKKNVSFETPIPLFWDYATIN